MQKEDYTVVVFSGAMASPKKFRLPKKFAKVGLIVLVTFLGTSLYFAQQYIKLQKNETELAKLRKESKIRKIQVEKFSHQVKNFETEMARLERFEKKLRVITALENSPKSVEKNWGLGGPFGLTTSSFNTSMSRGAANMVDRLSNRRGNLD